MAHNRHSIGLRDQIANVREETGARVIVLGEQHNYIGNIKALRADFQELKVDGYSSLYLEIGTNHQDLINKSLNGDKVAQRDLRLNFERWFGYYGGTEAAQQRYDMLFDAKKAGLRVLAVDMDDRMDHVQRYGSLVEDEEGQPLSSRLAIGDAMISKNIKRLDDGGRGLLLIGSAHTYNAAPGGHIENPGTDEEAHYYQSQHGGSSERLNALGIKTASIDFKGVETGIGALERGDGRSSDYNFLIPHERYVENAKYHVSSGYRVYWERLANVFDHAEIEAENGPNKAHASEYNKISTNLRGLGRMLDDTAFNKLSLPEQAAKLDQTTFRVVSQVMASIGHLDDSNHINAALAVSSMWLQQNSADNPMGQAKWHDVVADNHALQQSDARALWERPAATANYGQGMDMSAAMSRLMPQKESGAKSESEMSLKPREIMVP